MSRASTVSMRRVFPDFGRDSAHGQEVSKGKDRDRDLEKFTKGECWLMFATDVCARGLDIKGVTHVVNLDMARDVESYATCPDFEMAPASSIDSWTNDMQGDRGQLIFSGAGYANTIEIQLDAELHASFCRRGRRRLREIQTLGIEGLSLKEGTFGCGSVG
eukprot:s2415_g1.t1